MKAKIRLFVNDEEAHYLRNEWQVESIATVDRHDDSGLATILAPDYHTLKVEGVPDRRFRFIEFKDTEVFLSDEII